MAALTYDSERFYLNGEPFQIRSAAMHYFRVRPEYWQDRLEKIRDCGFNTVETYVCWNRHEQKEGQFDFSGILDICRFLQLAADTGLKVILRPGPFICGEWAGGGLPYWLLQVPGLVIRCMNAPFLQKTEHFFRVLFDRIRPYFACSGGPIIMVQVENEYGSYGNDKAYLQALVELDKKLGIRELLFTADGASELVFHAGSLPGVLATGTFGSNPAERMAFIKKARPEQPAMCMEYWCGWFDHWYEQHHTRDYHEVIADVREFMAAGASFNLYMFCGGTNFGFNNGANSNINMGYKPTATTYDYFAPIREDGSLSPLYYALQKELCREIPAPAAPILYGHYGTIPLAWRCTLEDGLSVLSAPVRNPRPLTFEQLDLDTGYVLYRTTLSGPMTAVPLNLSHVHDRAQIFLDGKPMQVVERGRASHAVPLTLEHGQTARLDILVENMGRINYGYKTMDRKGLIGGVMLGQQYLFDWEMWPLPMNHLENLPAAAHAAITVPGFFTGTLRIEGTPLDTFLYPLGLSKGFIMINGFLLGRYYNPAGPQKSLYLPGPLLHPGDNEVVVFESDAFTENGILLESRPVPDLGKE